MKTIYLFLMIVTFSIQAQESQKSYFSRNLNLAGNVIKTSFKTIPSDFVYMGKNVSDNWKQTALYTGIIGTLMLVDKPVTQFYQEEIETIIDYQIPHFSKNDFPWLGGNDAYMFFGISTMYIGSIFGGYEKGQYAAINGFKALGYSILISHITLKTLFGRARPYSNLKEKTSNFGNTATDDPFDFFNSRGGVYIFAGPKGTSLPSLHATAFFAMAKVFQMEFDNYWIPYGFMSAVFLADIKAHRHWVSDMVAGGIIGTIIGRSIVKSSWKARGLLPNKEQEVSFNWVPSISSKYTGLTLSAVF